jgi:hypothetical protein
MKRLHLLEIEDQPWCPSAVRDALTDHLQFTLAITRTYAPIIPVLARVLRLTGSRRIIDLCSGGAGPWPWLGPALSEQGLDVSVCLTDRYPNFQALRSTTKGGHGLTYCPNPVDATQVPDDLCGFRTIFTAFHHFEPARAKAILSDAVRQRQGIGVFEVTRRSASALALMLPAPLTVLACAPFIRPFRWSRLLFTYLLPLVPAVTLFDGLVSCLRTYDIHDLRELTRSFEAEDYQWEIGITKAKASPMPVTYLLGWPTRNGS